jgi:hypothetical protein
MAEHAVSRRLGHLNALALALVEGGCFYFGVSAAKLAQLSPICFQSRHAEAERMDRRSSTDAGQLARPNATTYSLQADGLALRSCDPEAVPPAEC